ncbi:MAG: transcription-repair coupling factor, partial [Lachnospiraceae bacterium]|nr:transcription-repair coupling factor [Lachnospiraceae bacterium]
KEVAEKRLEAIKEFTDLGSGFKIAMRDLEIRGAGNILGAKQHGHMQAVGYDLYCKMLNEAVKNLKGISTVEAFNTSIDLDVDAYIPPSYIVNEVQKLDIYKRIAGIEDDKECDDMKEELLDRFGEIPKSAENLLRIAMIRVKAHMLYMTEVKGKNELIQFIFRPDAQIEVGNIPILLQKYKGKLSFDPKGQPAFRFRYKKYGVVEKDEKLLLALTEGLLCDMQELLLS